ncbi:MAG TPA: sugar O-acetyltransferase [Longimicrobiaceae bacterium]|nr:sugar O-acetyltransferase [Longimicrobiaceae bacterium]
MVATEWEKMVSGQLYDPLDPALVAARRRARELLKAFNDSTEAETDERARILGELFGGVGEGLWIEPPFYCDYGSNITVGTRVFFNFDCVVLDVAPVRIGDRAMFGPAVQIYTATHPLSARERSAGREAGKPIEIGADVWVGGGAIILPGVSIGARCVIGAGSVVTKSLPEGVFAAGNPCRIIRELPE